MYLKWIHSKEFTRTFKWRPWLLTNLVTWNKSSVPFVKWRAEPCNKGWNKLNRFYQQTTLKPSVESWIYIRHGIDIYLMSVSLILLLFFLVKIKSSTFYTALYFPLPRSFLRANHCHCWHYWFSKSITLGLYVYYTYYLFFINSILAQY